MQPVDRLIVVDPLCEWGTVHKGCRPILVCTDWEQVIEAVRQDRFRISIEIPEPPQELLATACEIARSEDVGNCWLVVEELSLFFRRGEEAGDDIQGVVRFGRRENVNLLLISQRSYDCPIDIRSQLSDIYAFRSHEPRDIQALGQTVGKEQAQKVIALREHQHYHWDLTHPTLEPVEDGDGARYEPTGGDETPEVEPVEETEEWDEENS